MIYLDHNATTPPAPAVVAAMLPVLSSLWANSSSQHGPGQEARRALGAARSAVARVLGCKPVEVVFTSGATEANHMAVRGLLAAAAPERRRVVFSRIEHAGHLRLARALAESGVQVDFIPVLADGTLDLPAAAALIGPDVALVSLMAANNETGALMPVAEAAALAQAAGARLHVDATQFIGKQPFVFSTCGADAVSLSAHKFNGPKGVGALLLRQGTPFTAQTLGSQERGRRGGTENLAGIVGLAAALELLGDVSVEAARLAALRDALENGLIHALPATHIWCRSVPRLPGTSYLRFGQLSVDVVLQRLERLGVAASSGAACSSGGSEPSHVLTAMGVPADEALAAVRLSLGRTTTAEDVASLLALLPPLLEPLLQEEMLIAP
ncbi:cysteine desulfurase family protein [Polaromonas naphthalenivorans]|uniref:Aminotransferase, class V n=1 Tax=Polaromonas naphthalenivorans (strain CJ2) TaxID=365044 RepID=A1VML8_POLNA|nr:cysteine desulfurase family protein [Polaromonas naphthalenivorans]ABM36896.1 aminotransferase, class V [Polaromonas naphthalenivorans CJ2]